MSDATPATPNGQASAEQAARAADAALAANPGSSTPVTPPVVTAPMTTADERPELVVGAALAGGFVLGLLLKRLGR